MHTPELENVRALAGPNIYARKPVLEAQLEIGEYEERPSSSVPGFTEQLLEWLPGLYEHRCSVGRAGGFAERLRRGTYLPHITEHLAIALQNLAGFDVGYGRARLLRAPSRYRVLVEYEEETPARAALDLALRLALCAFAQCELDIDAALQAFLRLADDYRLGPSSHAIVQAARAKGIPVNRITPNRGLVQLGWGVRQKRIQASETSNTSAIAVDICQEKPLTNHMLRTVGVPVPEGMSAKSEEEALSRAAGIGFPVVVKPESGHQGKGVSVDIRTPDAVREAFATAQRYDSCVLVERHVQGKDYRLLVIDGRLVAAAEREPPAVIADGRRTVRQLVEAVNRDPRRGEGHSAALSRLPVDAESEAVLANQGLTFDSRPPAGTTVLLRTNANLSTRGTATDVTDRVHPDNARLAELAAQVLALDVAGIDIICPDIGISIRESGGAVVEVNAAPGLRMHLSPSRGRSRDVGTPIIDALFPGADNGRIPLLAVTGSNGKTTVVRLLAHMFETVHQVVGMTSTEGIWIDGERIVSGDCAGPKSARAVLMHPRVEVAVLETARGGILREGLAFDRASVGVVTNLCEDHLGIGGVETIQDLAMVKQVVVESVADSGCVVLNADDIRVAEMAAATRARVIYFARSADNALVRSHRAGGGWAVCERDGSIVLCAGPDEILLVELERLSFTAGGAIGFQVQNALAAAAASWGAGLNPAFIARALATFDMGLVPGRFNRIEHRGVEIIVDYAHNPPALEALGQGLQVLGERRTVMVVNLPGDRRNQDLEACGRAVAAYAHHVVLAEDDLRGRQPGEIGALLSRQLRAETTLTTVPQQPAAIAYAWSRVQPGDRLVIIADNVDGALEQIAELGIHQAEECNSDAARGAA